MTIKAILILILSWSCQSHVTWWDGELHEAEMMMWRRIMIHHHVVVPGVLVSQVCVGSSNSELRLIRLQPIIINTTYDLRNFNVDCLCHKIYVKVLRSTFTSSA